ncbi:MAG: hypothetical protein ACXAAN_12610 [Candidatus Thorarchaeota archaeon]|jgi:hypothetical protein
MSWEDFVNQDTLDWLLGPENPSVRFWALQQLEDKPIDDPEVIEAQDAVMSSSCVNTILENQRGEGNWVNHNDMYNPKYTATTHTLLILAELGAKRVPEIEKSIEHLFMFQRNSGHFLIKVPKTEKGKASIVKDGCCIDGNILYYLIHFGFLSDERTEKLIDFQVEYHSDDVGGWKCRAFPINKSNVFPENCYMGGVKMLRALTKIPKAQRSGDLNRIINQEVEIIFENGIFRYLRKPDGSRKEKAGWKRFGFPLFYQSDVLEVLDILTELGVKDDRMHDSIDLVISSQQNGRWLLKITLRATRVLRRFHS